MAMTEPNFGTDVLGMSTTTEKVAMSISSTEPKPTLPMDLSPYFLNLCQGRWEDYILHCHEIVRFIDQPHILKWGCVPPRE